jgi:hypothetical protein
MARELFKAAKKGSIDSSGTYRFDDVLVRDSFVFIDAYSMRSDGSTSAIIRTSGGITVTDYDSGTVIAAGDTVSLSDKQLWLVSSNVTSSAVGDAGLAVEFKDANGATTWKVAATLTIVSLEFRADFDRDGQIDSASPDSKNWTWGANGRGAVLLVNSDRDTAYPNRHFRDRHDRRINGPLDLQDMTEALVRFDAPAALDLSGFSVRVRVSDAAASRIRIFDRTPTLPRALIGPGIPTATWAAVPGTRELRFEGLDYPGTSCRIGGSRSTLQ